MSDKPSMFSSRSRWWTIDDHVEKDVPAIIRFVLKETHSKQVHFLGHSMVSCGTQHGESAPDWGSTVALLMQMVKCCGCWTDLACRACHSRWHCNSKENFTCFERCSN
jgi:hypothetical protein